jgi:predicted DNA-binding transcriptional regulator AlpA
MNVEEKRFYSMRDLAEIFGVSLSHIKQNVRWLLPKPMRVGKRTLRWSREQIDTFIKNQTDH